MEENLAQERIEYGLGYIIIRSPYTPNSIYLSGTIYSGGSNGGVKGGGK